jgi:tetratricopeptide (TPR) repeat protein
MRLAPFVRCSVMIAVAGFAALVPVSAKYQWLRATTDDVVIISDATPKVVTDYAVKYSAFRQAFVQLLGPTGQRPPPIVLILFQNEEELSACLSKSSETGSILAARIEVDNNAMIALADAPSRDKALSLAYEFDTVWTLRRIGYVLPGWMAQGTGEVMASLHIRKGECLIDGRLDRVGSSWNAGRALAWKQFFDLGPDSPEYEGKAAAGIYQAQAWALMNLVLLEEDKTRERFGLLAKKIQDRQGAQLSVEEVLGVPLEKIEPRLSRQLHNGHGIAVPFDEKAILTRLKIEPADGVELLVRLGDLLIAYEREEEGMGLIERAAAASPGSVLVNEALARREMRRHDQSAAVRYYRAAMTAGSVDPNAWLVSADDRLEQSKSFGADVAGGGGKSTLLALDEIHRALRLNPGDAGAWRLLGRAYFVAEQANEEGVAELSQAVNDDANGLQVRCYRGMLYSRLGKLAEANADLEYVIGHPHTAPVLVNSATVFKIQVQFIEDKQSVEKFLPEGRYADAHGVIDRGLERSAGTATAQNYKQLLSWVEENESWVKTVSLYKGKDWPGSLAAVKSFMETYPQSTLMGEARQLAASAEKFSKRSVHTPPAP